MLPYRRDSCAPSTLGSVAANNVGRLPSAEIPSDCLSALAVLSRRKHTHDRLGQVSGGEMVASTDAGPHLVASLGAAARLPKLYLPCEALRHPNLSRPKMHVSAAHPTQDQICVLGLT